MEHHPQIILVDGNYRRRAAITHMLSGSGIHVEPFEDIAELVASWPKSGVILVEDRDALIVGLFGHMAQASSWLPVIGFSEDLRVERVVAAIQEGAVSYLAWPCGSAELVAAVETASASQATFGAMKLREARARNKIDRLSAREREVLMGVAAGKSNRVIGEELSISPRTVEIHRANMLEKMDARHTSDAIRLVIEAQLVD